MPTMKHEALLLLLRNRPELVVELLSDVLGVGLPRHDEVRFESAELGDIQPAEYRADLVVVLERSGKPVLAVVVEVQLRPDAQKRYAWPAYLTVLRSRLRAPTHLLVIAPSRSVARWCAQPIALGHQSFVLEPLVLSPDGVPVVVELEQARRAPELAVLSAMAHGQGEHALPVASAALAAASGLDADRARFYTDLVLTWLGKAARHALEEMMEIGDYQYQSAFARRYVAKGRAEGEAKGRAQSVLTVLRARKLDVAPEAEQRIVACTDLAELDEWARRAVTVRSVDELFD